MNMDVYNRLIGVARARELISYGEIGRVAELDVANLSDLDALARILEEIADFDRTNGRPLLIVLVIREDLGMPAKGFFKYARSKKLQPRDADDITFFATEIKQVYAFWQGRDVEQP